MPRATRLAAGKLRHRVQLVRSTLAQDTFGGTRIDTASPYATEWASVESLSGRELFAAQQKVAEVTHKITIRWRRDVLEKDLVWFDDREFQIQFVENPDERRKLLVLLCIERDDSAREEGGGES